MHVCKLCLASNLFFFFFRNDSVGAGVYLPTFDVRTRPMILSDYGDEEL